MKQVVHYMLHVLGEIVLTLEKTLMFNHSIEITFNLLISDLRIMFLVYE